jgi:hypothetical protein
LEIRRQRLTKVLIEWRGKRLFPIEETLLLDERKRRRRALLPIRARDRERDRARAVFFFDFYFIFA